MKIVSIVGARPQFVKAAVVSRALRAHAQEILLHTGQHYDDNMSRVFFDELDIPRPDINLGVGSGSHAAQTGQIMLGVEQVLQAEAPDWLLVYGDTNSTLAGALAAAKLGVPVAHVEAGLRSFNRAMPEEINRVVCDHLSAALFCPTQTAVRNLAAEGVTGGVHLTGDVMADSLLYYRPLAEQRSTILERLDLRPGEYSLVTLHRAGNTDEPGRLHSIMTALGEIGQPLVLPLHPRTRNALELSGLHLADNLRVIDPVGYLDMLQLEANADAILTDSGGVQKEAYLLGVRCITLRDETEWVETVENGWNRLAGSDRRAIIEAHRDWHPVPPRPPVYGDGHAAEKIADILRASLELTENFEVR